MSLKLLDKILKMLNDEGIHELEDIRIKIKLKKEKFNLIIDSMEKMDLIELKNKKHIKITKFGLDSIK